MKRLCFLVIYLNSMCVHADTFSERLMGFAQERESVVTFRETWSADYLSEPVVTTGRMSYKAPDQLKKMIEHPERIVQQIAGDQLVITKEDKSSRVRLSDESVLAVGIYALRDLLAGNDVNLQARFKLDYKDAAGVWILKMVPRDDEIAAQIKVITIRGTGSRLSQIGMIYQNGNSSITDITHGE